MAAAPDERALATRAVRQALESDPLFSPLPEIALLREALLGEGGMGIVHLVLDQRLGRRAALKLIKGNASEARMRRFLREAIVTARLDHPGIPPVYDAGRTATGQSFILMRYVAGRSLASILHDETTPRPPLHELLDALVKVSEAVAYAHSRGIVHRDLKPANVMVGAFGEVLVMDWGLARTLSDEDGPVPGWGLLSEEPGPDDSRPAPAGLTNEGAVLGTLGYIPPEQAKGEDIDGRADVFALGAILTEILTGEPPVTGESSMALLAATVDGKIELPRDRDRGVPLELDAIAARALEPERDARYPDARAFAADLKAYLEGRPVSVVRYGPVARAGRFVRAHPALVTGTAVALVISTIAAVAIGRQYVEIGRTNRELARSLKNEHARAILADARMRLRLGAPPAELQRAAASAVASLRDEVILIDAGRLLADVGDREGAKKLLRAAADEYPDSLAALFELHRLEVENGRFSDTPPLRELLDRARRIGSESELFFVSEGFRLLGKKETARAKAMGERAIRVAPRFAPAWIILSEARRRLGELDGAFADATRAVELAPDSEDSFDERARVEIDRSELDAAVRDIDVAVRLAPTNPVFWSNRACARQQQGDLDGAMQDIKRACELAPTNPVLVANLAGLLDQRGDHREALAIYERVLAADPDFATALAGRGGARAALGETAAGLADLDRAIQLDPTCWEAWHNRGVARGQAHDFAGALADFDHAVETAPSRGLGWYNRGQAKMFSGNVPGALADFDQAILRLPRLPDPLRQRGTLRLVTGDLKGSLEDFDRAVALAPEDSVSLASRGQVRLNMGDMEGACRDFDRALSGRIEGPAKSMLLVNRGIARLRRNDPVAAIEDLTTALALDESLGLAWLTRGKAREAVKDARAADDYERALKLTLAPSDADQARRSLAALRGVSR